MSADAPRYCHLPECATDLTRRLDEQRWQFRKRLFCDKSCAAIYRERYQRAQRQGPSAIRPLRGRSDTSTPAEREAYRRAQALLAKAHPLEFRGLLDAELASADREAEESA